MSSRVAALLLATLGAGCAVGAPPGFSSGDSWSFPLVGALEGGPLLVPVTVHGKGPYLFLIDPDAPMSQLDAALARELDLRSDEGEEFINEADESRPTRFAEVLRITAGTLTVRSRDFLVLPAGTFNSGGREVRGLLGRDVLADSLVFGFDRDRGMGYIATQKGFHVPEGAITIRYSTRINTDAHGGIAPVNRRLVDAKINGHEHSLHVDLGDGLSQLRHSKWAGAGLKELALERELVDETGTLRKVDRGGFARVELHGITDDELLFVPYDDRRWYASDIDGTLGLDFFDGYTTWVNWHTDTLYLVPRGDTDRTAERIGRWGAVLPARCSADACTTATLLLPKPPDVIQAPPDAAPDADGVMRMPPQRPTLEVERPGDVADLAFEVMLEARTAAGEPTRLPRLIAIFPAGAAKVSQPIDTAYIGHSFAVVDVSPFVRGCPTKDACIYMLKSR